MIDEIPGAHDRPMHYAVPPVSFDDYSYFDSGPAPGQPSALVLDGGGAPGRHVPSGSVADAALLDRLVRAGWEITGHSAKNPATGTQVTLGDVLTPTQAEEVNAAAGGYPRHPLRIAPASSAPPPFSDGPPRPTMLDDGAPPMPVGGSERFSKGDRVDDHFLAQARAAGWDVRGNVAIAPDGTKFQSGEKMTFNQARVANLAGMRDQPNDDPPKTRGSQVVAVIG